MTKHVLNRILAFLASLGLISTMVPAHAADFSDVPATDAYYDAVNALQGAGVVEGYDDGTFKPSANINRAEFLKIVLESRDDIVFSGEDCFPDVSDEWFAKYICTAKKEGIVGGYPNGLFKPEQNITFVEAAKILSLAYKQPIEQFSPDWYEPYARALESSKAIPLEIEQLDVLLTRGEMAEMMYRLNEGITNRPSKGYMNVKYPEMKVNLASDSPQKATSCTDLKAFREEASRTNGTVDYYYRGIAESDAVAAPQAGGANKTANDYSQTNVQVAGVDEGDIVKTDGTYLYVVSGNVVRIILAVPANGMKEMSVINEEDTNFSPTDLYIDGDRLVVLGHRWEQGDYHIMDKRMISDSMIWPGPWYNTQKAEVRIYDISNKSAPKIDRKVSFDGNTVSSRKIGDKIYLVVNQPGYWGGPIPLGTVREIDVLPTFQDSANGDEKIAVAPCNSVTILPRVPTPQYLTVGVIPIRNKNTDVAREVILGNAQQIYASLDNLYIANTEWNYNWDERGGGSSNEKTNIFRFAFTDDGVSMEAQGTVPGRILNQFSMDEHESTFRIATTQGSSWDTARPSTNNLYVLNRNMQRTGAIEDIAPGEQIYSVRFVGDRTYMVTFKNIDPLFVIDTSDPRNPVILGKLKIPGYSNYLHPYDENHIIGFGKDAVDSKDPNFAWYQGMKIALFDVSDVANPKELHKVTIGDRGTDSPLLYNHKALLFDKERNLLAFPISVAEIPENLKTGNDGSAYGSTVFQGAYVYDLTIKDGFKQRGSITHYEEDDFKKAGDYLYSYGKDIERIVRIGESLLTVSIGKIESHDENSVREEGSLTLSSQDDIRY